MADPTPTRARSPLAGFAERLDAANDAPARIRLAEVPFLTQLTLRLAPGSAAAAAVAGVLGAPLPTAPNTTAVAGEIEVLWMGPDEWLATAPPAAAASLVEALEQAIGTEHATVVEVSDQHTAIDVAGADARDLLLKGCALDLHPRAFGVGRCAQTLLARANVVLVARDEEPAYRVFVRAAFAEYLAEWLLDAAAEYRGVAPLDLTAERSAVVA